MKYLEGKPYEEAEGDALPSYTGEVNGPRNSQGALIEEVDHFLNGDEAGDEEEISELSERARDMATKAGEASLEDIVQEPSPDIEVAVPSSTPRSVEGMSGEEIAIAYSEDPDQFGHEWPSLQLNRRANRTQSTPEVSDKPPKKLTSDEKNSNAKKHQRQANRHRRGM